MSTDWVIIIVNNIVIIIGIKRNAKYTKCLMFLVFGHGGWSSCALDGGDDKGFDEHRDDLEGHEDDPHVRLMVVPMVQDLDGKWGFLLSTCLLGLPLLFLYFYSEMMMMPGPSSFSIEMMMMAAVISVQILTWNICQLFTPGGCT